VRCPARGRRSAVSVGPPLFVQTSASHPFAGEREPSMCRTPRRIIVLLSVGATVHPRRAVTQVNAACLRDSRVHALRQKCTSDKNRPFVRSHPD
jgi:hypothetical protein